MATGPRPLGRDERKVIADALRRASSDTRTLIQTWREHVTLRGKPEQADTIAWMERLLGIQDRLASELEDQRYSLVLERRPQ